MQLVSVKALHLFIYVIIQLVLFCMLIIFYLHSILHKNTVLIDAIMVYQMFGKTITIFRLNKLISSHQVCTVLMKQ